MSLAVDLRWLGSVFGQQSHGILGRALHGAHYQIQRLSYVPGIIRGHGPPDVARPTQVPEVVQRMSDMSSPFGTRFEVGEEEVALALEPAT